MLMPRIDRYATLYFFHPFLNRVRNYDHEVPILMYHSVSDEKDGSLSAYYQTATTPRIFEEHMRLLFEKGCSVISLDEAAGHFLNGTSPEGRSVVLTFDDGYMDFYTLAFPILEKYGFAATVFLSTGYVDKHPLKFNGRVCLNWEMVRALHEKGINFGSHTVSHPELKYLERGEALKEIRISKEVIEERLGSPVTSFSYPYAFPEEMAEFKKHLKATLVECGYRNGVSTVVGRASWADDIHFLKRIPVNMFDDGRLLNAKLEGGYDWMHGVQYAGKLLKSKVN